MVLKKTTASYLKEYEVAINKPDGSFSHKEKRRDWVESKMVDMTPEEESELKAYWEMNKVRSKIPPSISDKQKLDWILSNGIDFVNHKINQNKLATDVLLPQIQEAEKKHALAYESYRQSMEGK